MATDGSIASLAAHIKLRACNEFEIKSNSPDELRAIQEDLVLALTSVRREWNRRTLPSKLPAELLLAVFLHALDKKPVVERRSRRQIARSYCVIGPVPATASKTLMSITHVCHLWRSAAVSWPLLWNHIPPGPRNISRLFAERSGSHLPLTLYDNTAEPQDRTLSQDGWRDLLWPRLQGLVICAHGQKAMPEYSRDNDMQTLGQNLRYLRITSDLQVRIGHRFRSEPTIIPTKMRLFGGGEALALKAFEFSLSAGAIYLDRFPVLAHLIIAHNLVWDVYFYVEDLLQLLANTPALETLHVMQCSSGFHYNPTRTAKWATVHLNRLRVGDVGIDDVTAAIAFVTCLRIPPTCMLDITPMWGGSSTPAELADFRHAPLGQFDELEVIIADAKTFEVRATRQSGGRLGLPFVARSEMRKPLYTVLLAPVLAALGPALSTVETLCVRSVWEGNDPKAGLLATVLAEADPHIDVLTTLVVLSASRNRKASPFVVAQAPASPEDERADIPAPVLTTIVLDIMDEDIPGVHEQLVALLKERAAQGHRVDLEIVGSEYEDEWEVWQTKEGEQRVEQLLHSGGVAELWYTER